MPIGPSEFIMCAVCGLEAPNARFGVVVRWLVSFIEAGAIDGCGGAGALAGAATEPPLAFVVAAVFGAFWIAILDSLSERIQH